MTVMATVTFVTSAMAPTMAIETGAMPLFRPLMLMTRPRMCSGVFPNKRLLLDDRNMVDVPPMIMEKNAAAISQGAQPSSKMPIALAAANNTMISPLRLENPTVARISPPITAPAPSADSKTPYAPAPAPSRSAASTGISARLANPMPCTPTATMSTERTSAFWALNLSPSPSSRSIDRPSRRPLKEGRRSWALKT